MESHKYVRWTLDAVLVGMLCVMLWVANGCESASHVVRPDGTIEDSSITLDGDATNKALDTIKDIIKDDDEE